MAESELVRYAKANATAEYRSVLIGALIQAWAQYDQIGPAMRWWRAETGLSSSTAFRWLRQYRLYGKKGLVPRQRGRRSRADA